MRGNLLVEDLSLPDELPPLDHFPPEHLCRHVVPVVPVQGRIAWEDGHLHLGPQLVGGHGQKVFQQAVDLNLRHPILCVFGEVPLRVGEGRWHD